MGFQKGNVSEQFQVLLASYPSGPGTRQFRSECLGAALEIETAQQDSLNVVGRIVTGLHTQTECLIHPRLWVAGTQQAADQSDDRLEFLLGCRQILGLDMGFSYRYMFLYLLTNFRIYDGNFSSVAASVVLNPVWRRQRCWKRGA